MFHTRPSGDYFVPRRQQNERASFSWAMVWMEGDDLHMGEAEIQKRQPKCHLQAFGHQPVADLQWPSP